MGTSLPSSVDSCKKKSARVRSCHLTSHKQEFLIQAPFPGCKQRSDRQLGNAYIVERLNQDWYEKMAAVQPACIASVRGVVDSVSAGTARSG